MAADKSKSIVDGQRLSHIAFIMDGNGRWAKKRVMPREYGHKMGAKVFRNIVRYCGDIGIKTVTVYAFSTENWKRPKNEIDSIMNLLDEYLNDCISEINSNNIRYKFIGDMSIFKGDLKEKIDKVEYLSKDMSLTLNVALNYGGRGEIVAACNKLIAEGAKEITEEDISSHIYTSNSPDPDLIVRTGGDIRLSNFLLWQSAYSELYFTKTLWPDFSESDVDLAVENFNKRKRRFGGIDNK